MYSPGCVTLLSHNHSARPPCLWPPPPVSAISPPLGFLISIAMSFDPIPTYLFSSLQLYVLLLSRFPLTSNKHFLKYQGNRGKAKATYDTHCMNNPNHLSIQQKLRACYVVHTVLSAQSIVTPPFVGLFSTPRAHILRIFFIFTIRNTRADCQPVFALPVHTD